MHTFDYDIAIVGAGPAGASTAMHLVRVEGIAPARIAVLDKARFPREKPCAGAISSLGLSVLERLGLPAVRADGHPLEVPSVAMTGVRVLFGGETAETGGALGVVVRRSQFDAYLLGAVRRDGADVRDGEGLVAIARVAGGLRVTTSARTFTCRFVAVCDGAGSPTRKLLGLREPERKGHLYVLETPPTPVDTGIARGLVDFDLDVIEDGLQGYYWDFPTVIDGRLQVSRGIYHANVTASSDVKRALGRALSARGVDIAGVKLKPFSTRPFTPRSQTWLPGVVLVGEAAGIDRTTGEGIAQALVMGGMAARHLARALRTGGASFVSYDRELRASVVGRHLLESAWLARRVYAPEGRAARRYLMRSEFARHCATRWYRGEPIPRRLQLRLAVGLAHSAVA